MNYPKGTTKEQWNQYEKELAAHEEHYAKTEPDPEDFPTEQAYTSALSQWRMDRSCFEPNKPGYYRANND